MLTSYNSVSSCRDKIFSDFLVRKENAPIKILRLVSFTKWRLNCLPAKPKSPFQNQIQNAEAQKPTPNLIRPFPPVKDPNSTSSIRTSLPQPIIFHRVPL